MGKEIIEAGLLKQGGAATEKLKKTISELKTRQNAYDQEVAQLMEKDLKQLAVVETDKPDPEGLKRWRFELSPFR